MTKCKVCGFRLSDEAKKCPICGTMKGSTKAGSMGAENANLPRYLCPSCKADIIGEHRFCPSCGKELSEVANMQDTKEQSKNNCIKCGAYLPIGAKFCHKCGAKQGTNCYKCGAILQSNAEFCNECGAKQKPTLINANSVANASGKMEETPLEAFEYEVCNGKYILKKLKDTSFIDVVIPKVFSEIGENAFRKCSNLEIIIIPNSVTKIGDGAFWGCFSLIIITIPDSVTEIGESTFSWCSSLESVIIPDSVTEIRAWAFWGCSSLKSVTIPDSVTEIGDMVFFGCSSLVNITIPNSVTKIGVEAFFGCYLLEDIIIPNSVTEILYRAFAACTSLENITIPSSVTKIGYEAFAICDLKNVSIENPNFKKSGIKLVFSSSPSFTEIKIGNKIVKVSELD